MKWQKVTRLINLGVVSYLSLGSFAYASEEAAASVGGISALAAAIAIGIAAFGGAIGQSQTAKAALEAIGRNPSADKKVFLPMIIGLALIESLVLYAFVIALVKT